MINRKTIRVLNELEIESRRNKKKRRKTFTGLGRANAIVTKEKCLSQRVVNHSFLCAVGDEKLIKRIRAVFSTKFLRFSTEDENKR